MNTNITYKELKNSISQQLANDNIANNISAYTEIYENKLKIATKQFTNLQDAKERVYKLKEQIFNDLDQNILEFEKNIKSNGAEVFWADTDLEALQLIYDILVSNGKKVVKSRNLIADEIFLNNFFENNNIKFTETNFGDFFLREKKESSTHIVHSALNYSKNDIVDFLKSKSLIKDNTKREDIVDTIRLLIRKHFFNADVGICGANFLIADTGSVSICENAGDVSLLSAWSKTLIVLTSIDKVIPSIKNLPTFLALYSSHSDGQKISIYNHIISGPKKDEEQDGPEKMYVVLLNNNRDAILKDVKIRPAAYCINCGACSNVCPVYKIIGGKAYSTPYCGPIGSIITPHLSQNNAYFLLSDASSLCGKCSNVCPVGLPLHELLLYNRYVSEKNPFIPKELKAIKFISSQFRSRKKIDLLKGKWKRIVLKMIFKNNWVAYRGNPNIPNYSFSESFSKKLK